MTEETEKNRKHAKLIWQADSVAREALHYLANENPAEYSTVCALAENNPDWMRRLLRAMYIAGYSDGEKASEVPPENATTH